MSIIDFDGACARANRVKQYGSKQLYSVYFNNCILYFSYQEVIGCTFQEGREQCTFITSEKWSVTTSRHCSIIRRETNAITVPYDTLNQKLKELLFL